LSVASSATRLPEIVLTAFGVNTGPVPLPGGKSRAWRVDQLVVKLVEFLTETLWRAEVVSVPADG